MHNKRITFTYYIDGQERKVIHALKVENILSDGLFECFYFHFLGVIDIF